MNRTTVMSEFWRKQYAEERWIRNVWSGIFLLLFALIGAAMFAAVMVGLYAG